MHFFKLGHTVTHICTMLQWFVVIVLLDITVLRVLSLLVCVLQATIAHRLQ